MIDDKYEPLTIQNLPKRLMAVRELTDQIGQNVDTWEVKEVGDGNLNLVFIVKSPSGAVIVKQALPYVRLVGDSWPLPLYRAYFEYHALTRQAARAEGTVPKIYYFNSDQALLVMEYLTPHKILREKLILGEKVENLATDVGQFCARTAFRGSDLSLDTAQVKNDRALFAGNVAIPAITEALVFTDPYFDANMNNHTAGLDAIVETIRNDVEMKARTQHFFRLYSAQQDTMCHGDLHSGSIMCTSTESKVIDPEFVTYGPFGFDLGMLFANYFMAFFSQIEHRGDNLEDYQNWILEVISETWSSFEKEFSDLWHTERTGMLYPKTMFEDQGHSSDKALISLLNDIWRNSLGFCGIEMHRRCLSLAHNADFERIDDLERRAPLEARNLMLGRDLILKSEKIRSTNDLLNLARKFNAEDFL
jgi:5-methylthioribose kinase